MRKKTDSVKEGATSTASLDRTDRKLLSLLTENANFSYSDLGKAVHLSAPAAHERVKRLKRDGVIKSVVAVIDGALVGRPLLAFVTVNTKSWTATRQLLELSRLPDIEEIHTITGENAMLLKIRTKNTQSLENLLGSIHGVEGVEGTCSHVVLSSYLERGPCCEV